MLIAEEYFTFEDYRKFMGKEYISSKEEYLSELRKFIRLQRNADKLRGIFTEKQIEDLNEYFNDY